MRQHRWILLNNIGVLYSIGGTARYILSVTSRAAQTGYTRQTSALIPFDRALISGIGSNMSLPSCMPQDQEFLPGQPPGYKIQPPLLNNQPQEKNDYELQRQRPNFLPLAPVNTACVPMNALGPAKSKCPFLKANVGNSTPNMLSKLSPTAKQQLMDQYTSPLGKRKCHSEMVSIMSTLYAKLLIVVGVAVPVAASVTERVPPYMNQVIKAPLCQILPCCSNCYNVVRACLLQAKQHHERVICSSRVFISTCI